MSMNFAASILISMARSAAELAESGGSGLLLDQASCLHSRDKFSTCAICVDACPVSALAAEQSEGTTSITLDTESCANCGLCARLCPVGALTIRDGAAELLALVSQQEKRHIVELVCDHHPAAEIGPPQSDLVVRSRGCLAALGPSLFMSLLALDVTHILLRLDACHACPLGQAQDQISRCAAQTEALLNSRNGRGSPLTLLKNRNDAWPSRTVRSLKMPAKSRRDFFRSFMGPQDLSPAARLLMLEDLPEEGKAPPAERQRLQLALSILPVELLSQEPLHAFGLSMIDAGDSCNACRSCERVCPTGAMQFAIDEADHYALIFDAGPCTNCAACIDLCEPGALQRGRTPALIDWFNGPQTLRGGPLSRCPRCGAGFAGESASGLCPVCDFRQKNPFGSRLPPQVHGKSKPPGEGDIRH